MVDLSKPCEEYDLDFFKEIEEELGVFPHFLALQKRYIEVGEFLKVKTDAFKIFSQRWNKAQVLIHGNIETRQQAKPKCSNSERKELLEAFLTLSKVPKSPSEVFAIF